MKTFLIGLIVFFGIQGWSFGQSSNEQKISDLVHEFLAKVDSREMHDRFWDEDLIYTSSAGQRHGKDKIMAGFSTENRTATGERTTYTAEQLIVRLYEEIAVVTFKLVAKNPDGSTQSYWNSGTFFNRNGTWKVINWQATKVGVN